MIYELMHKDIPVAEIDIDGNGNLKHLTKILDAAHFPYGTSPRHGSNDPSGLIRWWSNRRIPISRDDLKNIKGIRLLETATPGMILLACKGLSLSDCYWIREKGSTDTFDALNFFDNDFTYDLGDALVGKRNNGAIQWMSPDGTSEGNLKKRWKIISGHRVLLKAGTPPCHYEVYNEVIASAVMKHLNVPHVDYFLYRDDDQVYCGCEDFLGYSQDFVTAYMIHEGHKKPNDESEYEFMVRCYEELGIENARDVINTMLLVDYLVGNEDRHLNNFGLIRDAKTLRFLGPTPIFDTGSSLGYTLSDERLSVSKNVPWKPFATKAKPTQLDYIDALPEAILPNALLSLPKAIASIGASLPSSLSKTRKKAIVRFVSSRVGEVAKRYGLVYSEPSNGLSKNQQAIVAYIRSLGGSLYLAEDAAEALHCPRITIIRNLSRLAEQGVLVRVGSKKTGHWELI